MNETGDELILVLTNTPTAEIAESIADGAVERRLAAAAQVLGPARSTYRWQGSVCHAQEWVCLLKTHSRCLGDIESFIRDQHPYELPSILAVPVTGGSAAYLDWLRRGLAEPIGPGAEQ